MATKVFKKEITFLSPEHNFETDISEMVEVTKTAVFKELDRGDRSQINLVFSILGIANNGDAENIKMNPDGIASITLKAVETLLITDNAFTESDKTCFLGDNLALLNFGLWFLAEKIQPFFLPSQKIMP
jgi:hypothetical protein